MKPDRRAGYAGKVRQGEPVVRRKLACLVRDRAPGTTVHQAETGSPVTHSRSLGPGTPSSRSCPGLGCKWEDAHPLHPHKYISHVGGKAPGAVTRQGHGARGKQLGRARCWGPQAPPGMGAGSHTGIQSHQS